jgi:tetratricopeptide (TPR) repeat protein
MKIFFAMVLLLIANQHADAVKVRTLKVLKTVEPGSPTRLSQPIQDRPKHGSQAPSRETANALDQLDCHSDPMCFIRTAQSLADRGEQLDVALACVERAMAIPRRPNDAVPRESFFLTLAYVQIRRREFDQAIATLTRGAQRSPEYASLDQYLIYLGLAYENSGRIDAAIETYMTLAGGLKEISQEPSERLVTLYLKRFGSLGGLKEKIEANRLKARKKFFVDNHLLNIPAPAWSLQDLDGRQVNFSDFSKKSSC